MIHRVVVAVMINGVVISTDVYRFVRLLVAAWVLLLRTSAFVSGYARDERELFPTVFALCFGTTPANERMPFARSHGHRFQTPFAPNVVRCDHQSTRFVLTTRVRVHTRP